MSDPTPVAVVGASGYSGAELLRFLLMHPEADLVCLTSRQLAGTRLDGAFPRFGNSRAAGLAFSDANVDVIAASGARCAFLALPHGVAAEFAVPLLEKGLRVIDLSADFRLRSPSVYKEYYQHEHPAPALLEEAVYGLPERRAAQIRDARLVASPGCYPTSILLPLLPLLDRRMIALDGIVASSMSGTSGAGKSASVPLLFAECNESLRAYGAPKHRHLSEIEQELALAAGQSVTITFIPHLVPVTAGICTTISAALADPAPSLEDISKAYKEAYSNAPFVRLLGPGAFADTKNVTKTNFIDIGWHLDPRTRRVILSSAEDNLAKGAASQAIQSFNLMFGYPETTGLMIF